MSKIGYGWMIGLAVTVALTGVVVLYRRLKPIEADWWSLAWVVAWVVLFWPLLYYCIWRIRMKL